MRVSAVILSFNSARYLAKCVDSLAAELSRSGEPNEIWVVENGSTDGSVAELRRLEAKYPDLVRGIYCERNTGTTVSRNMALRRSSGRYILILDSDVEVPIGTVDHLIGVADADPKRGIVAPRLIYPDGRPQLSTDVFPTLGRKLRRFLSLRSLEAALRPPDPSGGVVAVDYAISAFWLFRRDVLDRVGPLDERIFYSPEDVDYCLRVWQAGYSVVYDPSVHAIHDAQEIGRGAKRPSFTWRHAKGLAYLFAKHRYALGRTRLYRRLGRSVAAAEARPG